MSKILLSLEAVQEERWATHQETGIKCCFKPLDAETDQKFTRESTGAGGHLDFLAYYGRITEHCVTKWEGVGAKATPVECNTETRAKLIKTHGFLVGGWIVKEAQSLAHFRTEEIAEAKKG